MTYREYCFFLRLRAAERRERQHALHHALGAQVRRQPERAR